MPCTGSSCGGSMNLHQLKGQTSHLRKHLEYLPSETKCIHCIHLYKLVTPDLNNNKKSTFKGFTQAYTGTVYVKLKCYQFPQKVPAY